MLQVRVWLRAEGREMSTPPKLLMGYGTLYLYLFRWQILGEMFYSDAGGIRR